MLTNQTNMTRSSSAPSIKSQSQDILDKMQDKSENLTRLSMIERKRMVDLKDAIEYISTEVKKYRDWSEDSAISFLRTQHLKKSKDVDEPESQSSTSKKTEKLRSERIDIANIGRETEKASKKSLNLLEAKLNTLLQTRSEIQNSNTRMKGEINHFRKLRLQTDINHQKLESNLVHTRSSIESILSESNQIVEERERIMERKENLERLNQEEQRNFQEHYMEMHEFITRQNRALEESLVKERKAERDERRGLSDSSSFNAGLMTSDSRPSDSSSSLEHDIRMARQVGDLTEFVLTEQSSLSTIHDRISAYEVLVEQLKKITGTSSLEEVVSYYVAQEEEIFSLYNFIQSVNTDIETVEESTSQLVQEITGYKENQQTQEEQRRKVVDDLQQKLEATLRITQEAEEERVTSHESVTQIGKKAYSLFTKLQCDQMENKSNTVGGGGGGGGGGSSGSGAGSNVSGGSAGVGGIVGNKANKSSSSSSSTSRSEGKISSFSQGFQESDVLFYMGCVEQKATEIIQDYLKITHIEGTHNNNNNNNNNHHHTNRPPTFTVGPNSPINWNFASSSSSSSFEPFVDLSAINVNEDDVLEGLNNSFSIGNNNNNNNNNNNLNSPTAFTGTLSSYSAPPTATATTSLNNHPNNTMMPTTTTTTTTNITANLNMNDDLNDSKPVDLLAFSERLKKKLGLTSSSSSSSNNNNNNNNHNNNNHTTGQGTGVTIGGGGGGGFSSPQGMKSKQKHHNKR